MPFCPRCREQYEARVMRCADCDVDLVEKLPPREAGAADAPDKVEGMFTFYTTTPELAERLVKLFSRSGHPALRHAEPIEMSGKTVYPLTVRESLAIQFMEQLNLDPESIQQTEHGPAVFLEPADESAEAQSDAAHSALLEESDGAIRRRGESVIPDLVSIVWRGERTARERAARLLAEMGVAGAQALTEVARKAIVEGDRERLHFAAGGLSKVHGYRPDETFGPFLEDRDPTTRALAALVIGRTGSRSALRLLVPLLEDAELGVREEAIEGLYFITHDDLGYEADAPETERAAAVARWQQRL
jgi:hypothetical protein